MRRLTQAAREGDADAQFNLGVLYDNGTDDNGYPITGNVGEAIKWLLAAARQGLPRAQLRVAEIYAGRPDNDGSHAEACFWFLLAKGNLAGAYRERAQSGYDRVAAGLSSLQIAAAVKRVQLWRPTIPARVTAHLPAERPRRSARS
jgi:TPR repeat protein